MLREELDKEKNRYREWQKAIENLDQIGGQGRIEVLNRKNSYQFYHVFKDSKGKWKKKYIKKSDIAFASRLLRQKYLSKLKKKISERLEAFYKLDSYENDELDKIYTSQHIAKRSIFDPLFPSKDQIIKNWERQEVKIKNSIKNTSEFLSKKGDKVKSKSEKIIADMLFDLGIPYKYERPLYLKDGSLVFPDFTILDSITLEEVYWEHFGMMDNPEYSNYALSKLRRYANNGITVADRLIMSMESSKITLNIIEIRNIILNRFKG